MERFDRAALAANLEHKGFFITSCLFGDASLDTLANDLPSPGTQGGARNLLRRSTAVQRIVRDGPLRQLATAVLGDSCVAVRAILFDKTPSANWKVAWHQDIAVAVEAHNDTPGFVAPSHKLGVPHYVAPAEVLEQMIAVRLHLDPCTADNGPVRVLAGTHRFGRLSHQQIERFREKTSETVCLAERGAVLVMKPLLLHASSPAVAPGHRRVLHVEFACGPLPATLAWYDAVA